MPNWGGGVSGAAKGAALGSVVPGIGTAIGAISGGLWGLFGGGKKKPKDEQKDEQNPETADVTALRQSSEETGQQGEQLAGQGQEAIAPVLKYLKDVMGGDPSAALAATAPERGRVIDQYDTARRAAAQFGARGGATNAAIADSHFQEANQLSDITSTAKRDATAQLASLGTAVTGLGLSAKQLASADLQTVINAIFGREQLKLEKRGQNMQAWSGLGQAAGSIIGGVLGK